MTDLQDALNSSAPMFDQVEVIARWQELPPGYEGGADASDSLQDLGSQVGPNGYAVKQNFDDGLPDPVTMTTGNDASGSMTMDLVGRPPNIADVFGVRGSPGSGSGTGTSVSIPNPTGVVYGDYVLVAIVLNGLGDVTDADADPYAEHGWELLETRDDVSVKLWIFGRPFYTAAPALNLTFASASYSWISSAWFANTVLGTLVDVRPGPRVGLSEAVSQTTHTLPAQNLPSRGWTVGIWASLNASGAWTQAASDTEVVESAGGTVRIEMSRSALLPSGDEQRVMTATTASATAIVAALGVPMIVMDRQSMDAVGYFSPFNEDSPVVGFERDTAPMEANVQVVTPAGVFKQNVFTGQMADIRVSGRTAGLSAVSATRLALDAALTLPTVFSNREGCSTDWLMSWIAARGGQYAGIAPSTKTRFWAPLHGSIHPHMTGPLGYGAAYFFRASSTPTGPFGLRPPQQIPGPFYTAMHAQQLEDETHQISLGPDRPYALDTEVPGIDVAEMNDFLSQDNSEGRLTFWIRGDPADAAPSSMDDDPTNVFLFDFFIFNPPTAATIRLQINAATRNPVVRLDSTQTLTGGPIPSDGEWHFCGFIWQYATGLARFRMDNVFWDLTGFTTTPASLPLTDAAQSASAAGGLVHSYNSHLPIAEVQLETGPGLFTEQFARFYPTPQAPSLNLLTRPTYQWIEVVAEPTPLQGWTVLQELAQATASWIRLNEADNLEFLPLEYFGEDDQMMPEDVVLDTETNAADLDVVNDPSLTRNVVTVTYAETRVDTPNRGPIMDISSPLTFPRGVTTVTFPLDIQTAEIHGATGPYTGPTWDLTKLTALQVAGTNPLPNEHFMSVNTKDDGTGTVYVSANFSARIVGWDTSTVTIRFTNFSPGTLWLANNGSGVPFLRILGYAIRVATAYSTVSDPGSVGKRRDRALTTEAAWITRRSEGEGLANRLVAVLSQPRIQVAVRVMGNPARKPGNLITLLDDEGTKAEGTWRILSIVHNGNGPQYTQDLQLLRVPDVLIWDEGNWDETVWGA